MKRSVLFVLPVLLVPACSSPQEIKAIAESNLRDYAPAVNLIAGSCVGSDSDGDSYVSCSATDKTGAVQTVLCSSQDGVGCKPFVLVEDDD